MSRAFWFVPMVSTVGESVSAKESEGPNAIQKVTSHGTSVPELSWHDDPLCCLLICCDTMRCDAIPNSLVDESGSNRVNGSTAGPRDCQF
jgi:hypothetical protein